jgi:DNA-binding PadR family transcriptional regulator
VAAAGGLAMMAGGGRRRHARIENFERMAAVRHMAGGAPFGGGPGFGGGPPFGGGRGRKRRGDVRIALLLLIAEEPRNGYQLMQTIEERSGGRWRPSPGSVYPALSQLEDEGLIRAVDRDGSKVFEITEEGGKRIGECKGDAAPWEFAEDPAFESMADVRSMLKQVGMAAWQVIQAGDERQVQRAQQALADTRRALYRILAEDGAADPDA